MKKKLKFAGYLIGFIILLIIVQYQFTENASWKSWNLPLSGKIIILDPGHGGPDGGAVGGDVLEKDVALKVTILLKDFLQEQGALVILTREDDHDLASSGTKGYSKRKTEDLKKRAEIVNESQGDLFISVHLNAIPSSKYRGAQTFYNPNYIENKEIARFIQDEFRTTLDNTTRKAKAISGVYLLKNANIPGSLVEVGFLSNSAERNLLSDDTYQETLAFSIYKGIIRYFSNEGKAPE
ncbi:N-acetylmuramoyl-L-alanine amidase CwlD [Cytobacillus sp. IB215665]|uniref:N-acetylmuramoyl-L-alanine amidase CwlD n=1 Tax=Cytobacillus sp. IB215665 TaxID=3097357 RepID=UPI002A0B02D1|nr:N-acetylmuramoyl-L-alanine amidase CwlD [Cytobacillus sp. IB215665]MDX8367531.1 N-acetylmuramoyl-L-alanine amidase CwlD [Cytobacillus sp. IB215665]